MIRQQHRFENKEQWFEICKCHLDSVATVRFPLNGNIFKKASLSPLGINLIEYIDPSHQSGSVGTVRFPLTGHILKEASLSPLGINLIEYRNLWYDLFYFYQLIIILKWKSQKWLTCSLEDLQLIEEDCLILADFMLFLWDFEAMKLVVCLLKLALVIR